MQETRLSIARACRSPSNQQGETKAAHQTRQEEDLRNQIRDGNERGTHSGDGNRVKQHKVEVMINQQKVEIEIDSAAGAAVTFVNKSDFKALWSKRKAPDWVGHKYNYGHIQENH